MRAAISARSSSRMRSARSVVSCQIHGPITSTSAPTTAPGAINGPDAPWRLRKMTAPALASTTPSTGSVPPARIDPPRTRITTSPTSSIATETASRRTAGHSRRPSSYTHRARYATMPAPPASASSANTSRTSVASTPRRAARPPHTPARTRSCRLRSKASADTRSVARPHDVDPAGADVGVDDEQAVAVGLDLRVAAVVVPAEGIDLTGLDLRVHRHRHAAGDDDPQVAHADLGRHVRRPRHGDAREVDAQVADAELVRPVQRDHARGRLGAVADPVAEADVEPCERNRDGGDDRGRGHRQQGEHREEEPPRAAVALAGVVRPEDH